MTIQSKISAMPDGPRCQPSASAPTGLRGVASTIAGSYDRERAYSRTLEQRLSKACLLLAMQCDYRERHGDDVAHIRAFLRESAV